MQSASIHPSIHQSIAPFGMPGNIAQERKKKNNSLVPNLSQKPRLGGLFVETLTSGLRGGIGGIAFLAHESGEETASFLGRLRV